MSSPSASPVTLPLESTAPGTLLQGRAVPQAARALALLTLWTCAGLVSATQIYGLYQLRDPSFTFWQAVAWQLPPWYVWGLASPLILRLLRRFPLDTRRWPAAAAVHLTANALVGLTHLLVLSGTGLLVGASHYVEKSYPTLLHWLVLKNLHLELLIYWGVIAGGYAFELQRRLRAKELASAQLETQLAQAQLDALKSQLHPHFLFNTLHTIGVLIRKQDIQGAIRMLTGVSELLRLALRNDGRQFHSLEEELSFVDRYLEIERTRFQDRLTVERDIPSELHDAEVPNLILQPLVENALKHGIASRAAPGKVQLSARRDGARLSITIRDDGPGLLGAGGGELNRGVGCANVRARLEQLYPGAHRFTLEDDPRGGARATVELPLRPSGSRR